jgi:hypothetical protein
LPAPTPNFDAKSFREIIDSALPPRTSLPISVTPKLAALSDRRDLKPSSASDETIVSSTPLGRTPSKSLPRLDDIDHRQIDVSVSAIPSASVIGSSATFTAAASRSPALRQASRSPIKSRLAATDAHTAEQTSARADEVFCVPRYGSSGRLASTGAMWNSVGCSVHR